MKLRATPLSREVIHKVDVGRGCAVVSLRQLYARAYTPYSGGRYYILKNYGALRNKRRIYFSLGVGGDPPRSSACPLSTSKMLIGDIH